jgi:SNF2 family DNA or RNA helicase
MSYPTKGKLRKHQVKALNEANEKTGHAYWLDPGAGKTLMCLAEAGKLWEDQKIDGLLVIAPNGPHQQWIEEQAPIWMNIPWTGVHNKMAKGAIKRFMTASDVGFPIASINYDAIRTAKGQEFIKDFTEKYPRFYLVLDESHKIKNPRAQRTAAALWYSIRAKYTRVLSGTPILNGIENLWSQYEACEAGLAWPHEPITKLKTKLGVKTYGYIGYRNHYCKLAPVPGNPRAQRIVGYRNEEELQLRTKGYATRVMSSEFMKGDKPDIMTVHTPMNPAQKVQYNMMETNLIAMLDSGLITVQNALVQLNKLQQIASGFMYDEEKVVHWLGNNKIDAMTDLVEQLAEPTLIWTPFIPLRNAVAMRLREIDKPFIEYKTLDDVKRWKDMDNGILLGNQTSGMGVGLNLQHAAANIYVGNNFSAEARWQSIKRTDRMGQTKQVRVWDLTAPNTVDAKVMKALNVKEDISRVNIDGLRDLLI